jgi:hypothetical protein
MLYTLGYSNFESAQKIAEIAETANATIIDIRFRAWSRKMEFCGNRLSALLGNRYFAIPQFGNSNYHDPTLPFRIADFFGGQDAIQELGGNIILMCTCKEYLKCHRSIVAPRLTALPEFSDGYIEIKSINQLLQPALI